MRLDVGEQNKGSPSSDQKVVSSTDFIIITKDVLSEAAQSSVSNVTQSNSTQPALSTPPSQTVQTPNEESTVTSILSDIDVSSQLLSPTHDNSEDKVAVPTVSVPVATVATISIEPSKVVPLEEVSTTVSMVDIEETQKSEVSSQKILTPGEVILDPSIATVSNPADTSQKTPSLDSGTVVGSQQKESKPLESTASQPVQSQESKKNDQSPDTEMEVSSAKMEIVSTKVSMTTESPNTRDSLELFDSDAEVMSSIVDKLASAILDDPQNGHSRIINDTVMAANTTQKSTGTPQKDLGLVNVKVPVLPHSKREIALMRLANRINALEMNVTLSIRFLERMSQKFKTKSDEMIKALNKTDTKLEETMLETNTRGKKQEDDMKRMELKLRNLTMIMEEMVHNMDTLNQKVTDRQMVWTSVEVVILMLIFMVCLKRGKSTPYIPMSPEVQKILEKFPNEMDLTALPRRNSFHGTSQCSSAEKVTGSLQKYNSETALSCNRPEISSYDRGGASKESSFINQQKDIPKKKKRKKKSPDAKTCDAPSSSDFKDKPSLVESHTNFNSAGLLFGASPGEASVCEKLDRTSSEWNRTPDSNNMCQSQVDSTCCKTAYSDTLVTTKGQGSKVRVSSSTNDIPGSVPWGTNKGIKVKAHSFTNELPVSVISSKPPKCPVAPQGGGKSKRGSPPMMRALADPGGGGGGGGASKKKRHTYGHSIQLDNNTQAPPEVETVRPNINGIHIPTNQTTVSENNKENLSQQPRPKRKSHKRASSADMSSSLGTDTNATSWKKVFGWK
ncbi:SUN domain-containing ossification factor-like [Pecten maximus]|uniref:SUN domain-containing ossification factor-like n=1 Tax=Pecten maximus TaxID=6579 RepID=UPI001458DC5E|nr:SUN domain-containing ossification factor-like [Pecten maximus]